MAGNQATDHGIPNVNVGLFCVSKNKKRVRSVAEIEGVAEEQVEEKVVLIEAETEKRGVDMFEIVGGDEALEE